MPSVRLPTYENREAVYVRHLNRHDAPRRFASCGLRTSFQVCGFLESKDAKVSDAFDGGIRTSACSGPESACLLIDNLPHDAVVARPLKRSVRMLSISMVLMDVNHETSVPITSFSFHVCGSGSK